MNPELSDDYPMGSKMWHILKRAEHQRWVTDEIKSMPEFYKKENSDFIHLKLDYCLGWLDNVVEE